MRFFPSLLLFRGRAAGVFMMFMSCLNIDSHFISWLLQCGVRRPSAAGAKRATLGRASESLTNSV